MTGGPGLSRRAVLAGVAAGAALLPARLPAAGGPPVVAGGLAFPEGIVALKDGGLVFVQIATGLLCRVSPAGAVSTIATLGGGPNGVTVGPDGMLYVANNGGIGYRRVGARIVLAGLPADYRSGWIDRVDPRSGAVTRLYTDVGGNALKAPNDIVCDADGDLWFTDTGKTHPRYRDNGGLYWAKRDGSEIREIVYPLQNPNGIALAADRRTLYVALSDRREIVAYTIVAPGRLALAADKPRATMVAALGGEMLFDNVAIEASGNLVVACVLAGCLVTLSPSGREIDRTALPDSAPTALAFGGPDMRSLFVTLSSGGTIVRLPWPRPGLPSVYRL